MRFDGWCAARRLEPELLPPPRLCNLIYYWLTEGASDESMAKFDALLFQPPPDAKVDEVNQGPWSRESEMAAFTAIASQ